MKRGKITLSCNISVPLCQPACLSVCLSVPRSLIIHETLGVFLCNLTMGSCNEHLRVPNVFKIGKYNDDALVDLGAFMNVSRMYLSAKCLSERKILIRKFAEKMKRKVDVKYTYFLSPTVFEMFKPNGERAPDLLH